MPVYQQLLKLRTECECFQSANKGEIAAPARELGCSF